MLRELSHVTSFMASEIGLANGGVLVPAPCAPFEGAIPGLVRQFLTVVSLRPPCQSPPPFPPEGQWVCRQIGGVHQNTRTISFLPFWCTFSAVQHLVEQGGFEALHRQIGPITRRKPIRPISQ